MLRFSRCGKSAILWDYCHRAAMAGHRVVLVCLRRGSEDLPRLPRPMRGSGGPGKHIQHTSEDITFHTTTPHRTTLHHTIPYQIPHHTTSYHTIPYHIIPYHTIPYRTIPYHTIPYHTTPFHTPPHHTKCVFFVFLFPGLCHGSYHSDPWVGFYLTGRAGIFANSHGSGRVTLSPDQTRPDPRCFDPDT